MYLGLVGPGGTEIMKRGYRRVCLDDVKWAMLPGEQTGMCLVFINLDEIHFPRPLELWGSVSPALFKEPDSPSSMHLIKSKPVYVDVGMHLCFNRGQLKFDSTFLQPIEAR